MITPPNQVYLPLQFPQILEIVKQLSLTEKQKLLLFLLGRFADSDDAVLTHFASEHALAQDWLTSVEDEAWQDL